MGTPAFAVPSAETLVQSDIDLVGVVTAPDRPKGRGQRVVPPAVKEVAIARGIPVLQPEKIKSPDAVEQIRAFHPDLIVVVAYGQILTKTLLDIPPRGCINVHASLLPRYRGAAPIQWAIIRGEKRTGVTTMLMDVGLDTGPMLMQEEVAIGEHERAGELAQRLSHTGAALLLKTIRGLEYGELTPIPQEDNKATYAPMLKKADGQIVWDRPAREIVNLVRGTDPWPGAWTSYGDEPWRIWTAVEAARGQGQWAPGTIAAIERGGDGEPGQISVATEGGWVVIQELQTPNRRRMTVREFLAGHHVNVGGILGDRARV